MDYEKYIKRCINLAKCGIANVSPNPMVAAIIVADDKIIGEGYHRKYGEDHAEVVAIKSVKDKELLCKSTLYVSLEPCSHFGKTPPCVNLIIESKIPNVVVGCKDPNPIVSGKGIEILKKAGINVTIGILEKECQFLNRRFFTFHQKKRPYIILKWAASLDNFIDIKRNSSEIEPVFFIDEFGRAIVHKWRSEEDAILVGRNTVTLDNPKLTSRNYFGRNPIKIVINKNNDLNKNLHIFDKEFKTIIFNSIISLDEGNIKYIKIDFTENVVLQVINILYIMKISSIIVEGGSITLNSFIKENLWDEARVFTSNIKLKEGIKSPEFNYIPEKEINFKNYKLSTYFNYGTYL